MALCLCAVHAKCPGTRGTVGGAETANLLTCMVFREGYGSIRDIV